MRRISTRRFMITAFVATAMVGMVLTAILSSPASAAEMGLTTFTLNQTDPTPSPKAAAAPGQGSPGGAQDCDLSDIANQILAFEIDENDLDAAILSLLDLQRRIRAVVVACRGYAFEGTDNRAVGPIVLEPGIYRIWVRGSSRFSANLAVFRGTCITPNQNTVWSSFDSGSAQNGGETLVFSEGCEAVISIDSGFGRSDPWELIIEPVQITIR